MGDRINIAIDGPASSGKGTVARMVAKTLGFAYIDSGAMYRAVALFSHRENISWEDEESLSSLARRMSFAFSWSGSDLRIIVGEEDVTGLLRNEAIGIGASHVAVHPQVRASLLARQREVAALGGVVMDGRDIGSVVLPQARLKVFLDASVSERARRRIHEIEKRGLVADHAKIEAEIMMRDEQDRNRSTAPLLQTADAVYVDTTGRTAEEAALEIVGLAQALIGDSA